MLDPVNTSSLSLPQHVHTTQSFMQHAKLLRFFKNNLNNYFFFILTLLFVNYHIDVTF